MIRGSLFLLSSLLLSGCSWFGSKDNAESPVLLEEFTPTLSLKVLWTAQAGGGVGDKGFFKLAPIFDQGKIFVASPKGQVTALDFAHGQVIWQQKIEATLSGGPGVGENLVLVGGHDGEVLAFSETDGHKLWQTNVSSEVVVAPRLSEGKVVVRTVDGKLFALESQTGKRLWVYERNVPILSLRGTSTPVINKGIVISGFDNGKLVALELQTGKLLWELDVSVPRGRTELERMVDIDADPLWVNNTIYVTSYQGRTVAVDSSQGKVIWERETSSHIGLGIDDETLYLSDSRSHLWAFHLNSGASLWKQTKLQSRDITAPVRVGEYVVVGDKEGFVHWMKRENGQFVARYLAGNARIFVSPLVVEDTMVIYNSHGDLIALQAEK